MPDWSYHTVLRPLLFRLRPEAGRDVALGAMGRLARFPGGVRIIQLLGHMAPDARLGTTRAGITFPAPVGLSSRLDPRLVATRALSELGVGYLEVGPIVAGDAAARSAGPITRDTAAGTLHFAEPQATVGVDDARARLAACGRLRTPVLARIGPATAADASRIIAALAPHVAAFVAEPESLDLVADANAERGDAAPPVFVALSRDQWRDSATQRQCEEAASVGRISGVMVEGPTGENGARQLGAASRQEALQAIGEIRTALGPDATLIAAASIHSPADALDAVAAGADLVQLDSGLVFTGPGLPKRINDALLYQQLHTAQAPAPDASPAALRLPEQSWFWALLMGLSLLSGGVLALAIAATRVTLPYDEALTGLTRDQLAAINPRLLAFMKHDRITLAGTMLALGLQYAALAYYGVRRGLHWAYATLTTSALTGFFTFFAFLGFGYFDPFHAFVATILLQLTLLTMHARLGSREFAAPPDLDNNEAWRSNQWGQLLFVIHGAVLIVAGAVIVGIGMTHVFIREDLEFLSTTAEELVGAHPQLKPLVAHDRATFGGMLISCGIATLLSALWGFQRGQGWLWWSLMVGGNLAYLSALAVHLNVGYSSHLHLLPVYGGFAWLWAGGLFSYPFLVGHDEQLETAWRTRLANNL